MKSFVFILLALTANYNQTALAQQAQPDSGFVETQPEQDPFADPDPTELPPNAPAVAPAPASPQPEADETEDPFLADDDQARPGDLPPMHPVPDSSVSEEVAADDTIENKKLTYAEVSEILKDKGDKYSLAVAELIAFTFKKYGEPTAVILGSEGGAQLVVGYSKGKGTIKFKNKSEDKKIYWNSPAVGFGAEVRGGQVAILIYGATDMEQIVGKTYAGVKGAAHFIGGGAIQYLQESDKIGKKGTVALAHVSIGLGLGATASIEALTITDRNCITGKWLCF